MKIKPWLKWSLLPLITIASFYILKNNKVNTNWQFLVENQIGAQSTLNIGKNITFDDQNLFFGDDKNTIYSLQQKNGQLNWKTELPDHTPFQVTQDQNSLYVANFDSHIYKLDKNNGHIEWSFTIPNFFWPDTEAVFDENDEYVFFGDRGGFVYAVDKKTGRQVWQQEIGTLDSTQAFIKKEIHLGFLKQNEDELILEHFPQQRTYVLDKKTGDIKSKQVMNPNFQIGADVYQLDFEKNHLLIKNNVAQQPQLVLVDQSWNQIWSYQVPFKINPQEFYQFKDRVFYLDANNQVLTSILINDTPPLDKNFCQLNFKKIEDFSTHEPFKEQKNPNPQIDFQESFHNWHNWRWQIRKKLLSFDYFFKHFQEIFSFQISHQERPEFTELTLHHQDNFYKNKFIQANITASFVNPAAHQEINVNGFYFDKDTWKIRARLEAGEWEYQLKIHTPFTQKKLTGKITVSASPRSQLKIEEDSLVLDDELFIPLGLQTSIIERNQDGNPLNQIGYSDMKIPPTDITQQKFLPWDQYLAAYQQQAELNIFRYGPDNWAPAIWEDLSSPQNFVMKINGGLYGDYLLETAKKHHYQTIMSIFSFYPLYITTESIGDPQHQQVITQYLDYIIARYASLVDIWELSNEALPSQEWEDFVSDYLHENDPYKHPITTSLENPNLKNSHLLSRHEYVPIPENNQQLVAQIEKFYNQYPDWSGAQLMTEFGFQGSNHTNDSADWLRKFAWIFAMNKTGIIFWNTGERLNQHHSNANTYLGPTEREYLRVINEVLGDSTALATPKSKLGFDLPKLSKETKTENYRDEENQVQVYRMVDEKNGIEIYYLLRLEDKNNSPISIQSSLLNKPSITNDYQVSIINPQNGDTIKTIKVDEQTETILVPKFSNDLIMRVNQMIYEK